MDWIRRLESALNNSIFEHATLKNSKECVCAYACINTSSGTHVIVILIRQYFGYAI